MARKPRLLRHKKNSPTIRCLRCNELSDSCNPRCYSCKSDMYQGATRPIYNLLIRLFAAHLHPSREKWSGSKSAKKHYEINRTSKAIGIHLRSEEIENPWLTRLVITETIRTHRTKETICDLYMTDKYFYSCFVTEAHIKTSYGEIFYTPESGWTEWGGQWASGVAFRGIIRMNRSEAHAAAKFFESMTVPERIWVNVILK